MRSGALAGLVVVSLAVAAAGSPAVTAGLAALGWRVSLPRVYDRVFEVALGVGLVWCWRRLDLGSATQIGVRQTGWFRDLGRGLGAGLGGVMIGLTFAWLWGSVVPVLRFAPGKTVWKAALGCAGALLIGVGEEALFRGVLLRRFRLDLGARTAMVVTTTIYAVVHALRTRGGGDLSGPWSGVTRTVGLFAPLAEPTVWPSVGGLLLLGLILAWARVQTGSLWVPIGIHAAWVGVFRVGRLFVDIRPRPVWVVGPGWPPLIGGVAGMVGLAMTAILLWRLARRWPESP